MHVVDINILHFISVVYDFTEIRRVFHKLGATMLKLRTPINVLADERKEKYIIT